MRIGNHGIGRSSELRLDPAQAGKSNAAKKAGEQRAAAPSGGDVAELTQLLRSQPDDRAEVVSAAKARLSAGEYLTQASAEATAEAILKTLG